MKKIRKVNLKPKRSLEGLDIDFWYGLKGNVFTGILFLVFGLLAIISIAISPRELDLIFWKFTGGFVFGNFGLVILLKAFSRYKSRVIALKDGELVKGKVVETGSKYVAWRSRRFLTADIGFSSNGKKWVVKIFTPDMEFNEKFRIGSEIDILFEKRSGAYFVPVELGLEFDFIK